jgi:hypothetical protein
MEKNPQRVDRKIISRIYGHERGWVFTPGHFKNPADENADVWSAFNPFQTCKDEIGELCDRRDGYRHKENA